MPCLSGRRGDLSECARVPAPLSTDAALQAWLILIRKWRSIPDGLSIIAHESTPLGFWRRVVMESRDVILPLKP